MFRMSDAEATSLNMRVIQAPTEPLSSLQKLKLHEEETGFDIMSQIKRVLRNYPNYDRKVRIRKFIPVPRPDYELNYGGPYSHIIDAYYCEKWCATFGLRTDGQIVLWMD